MMDANGQVEKTAATPGSPVEDFSVLAERVDKAVAEVRALDKEPQVKALAMKAAIEAFHKVGLVKIVQTLKADPQGKALLFELIDDPAVHMLFAMHGIVRADLRTRVSRVIDMVRPYMKSHGGDVELVDVTPDTAFIRLSGACNGCSMSSVTLRNGVEEALKENVPEIKKIEVLPNDPSPAIISLDSIGVIPGQDEGWVRGPMAEMLANGKPYCFDVNGVSVLIVKIDNRLSAFRNACAHQGLPIDGGIVDASNGTITCPWHGWCYDAGSGECLTAPAAQLEPFPLRVEDGVIWIRPL
jgi:nitrite reductase/ring-hydroxylating ferredoxin subunit/Fe-S cluster biogenesis protein NfuA